MSAYKHVLNDIRQDLEAANAIVDMAHDTANAALNRGELKTEDDVDRRVDRVLRVYCALLKGERKVHSGYTVAEWLKAKKG